MSGGDIDELVAAYCTADTTDDGFGLECGIIAVARAVLANVEHWRKTLGVEPVRPQYVIQTTPLPWDQMHRLTGPTSQQLADTQYHHLTAARPAYDPARSTLEQRLDLASLNRAEGRE